MKPLRAIVVAALVAAAGAAMTGRTTAQTAGTADGGVNLANCLRAGAPAAGMSDLCADFQVAAAAVVRRTDMRRTDSGEHGTKPMAAPVRPAPEEVMRSESGRAGIPLARPARACVQPPDFLLQDRDRLKAAGLYYAAGGASRKTGVAVAVPAGCLIHSPLDGEIVFASPFAGYGNTVIVKRGAGDYLVVAGFSKLHVARGERVKKGTPLGHSPRQNAEALREAFRPGEGVVLYLEVKSANGSTDPLTWLAALS
ncbi:MAG: M23 family metallopeptidase [Parvibaculum sp.]|nr:M23 family metallopeptidase [Parvibaculum sp.]